MFDELYQLRLKILDSGNFVELSAGYSKLEEDEIRMGYIGQGHHLPEIESTIFSMIPGEISPIIPTRFGFHMFEVTGRKEPKPVPIEEIPSLEEDFLINRREQAIDNIIKTLVKEGSVEEVTETN